MAIETSTPAPPTSVGDEGLNPLSVKKEEQTPITPITRDRDGAEAKAKTGRNIKMPLAEGPSLSYWLQGVRSNPLIDYRSAGELPDTADVVVIGSGLTGTLAALELLTSPTPPKSVLLLEARELCSGATGRNAGHCKPDVWRGFTKYAQAFGAGEAIKILANEKATYDKVVDYVRQYKVDCDAWIGQTLDVAMTPEVKKRFADNYDAFKAAGGDVSALEVVTDPAKAEEKSRIKGALSVYAWDAATFYPWKLVAHLIKRALDLGLNLQTWTPVTAVVPAKTDGQWEVVTDRGSVVTPTVIHATNAYAAALLPETEGAVRPIPHMCNKVIPPPSHAGMRTLQNSYAVAYNEGMYTINPRCTSDGIILFGGGAPNQHKLYEYVAEDPARRTDDSLIDFEPVTEAVRKFTREGFGWSTEANGSKGNLPRYDYAWSGITGRSTDAVPMIGEVPGKAGQWFCGCHQGHGMARIFTVAPGLVKMIQGATWEEVGLPSCFRLTGERLDKLRAEYKKEQSS